MFSTLSKGQKLTASFGFGYAALWKTFLVKSHRSLLTKAYHKDIQTQNQKNGLFGWILSNFPSLKIGRKIGQGLRGARRGSGEERGGILSTNSPQSALFLKRRTKTLARYWEV
jgi:hypothetical protein